MISTRKSLGLTHTALLSSLVLIFCLGFGVAGVARLFEKFNRPPAVQAEPLPDTRFSGLTIDAKSQGSAEADMLARLLNIAEREHVTVRVATFKPAKTPNTVILTFELEGAQGAVWRAVSALESNAPLIVFNQARAASRDLGDTLTLTGDIQASWASLAPTNATQAGSVQ